MRRRDKRERRSTRRGYDRGGEGRGIESFATELGERERERERTNQPTKGEGGSSVPKGRVS
jgi:hypothetical protein